MSPKRVPIKGEPNFTNISDERLREFVDLAQQMIFVYEDCDSEKTRVLKEVWKQMSVEHTSRLSERTMRKLDSQDEVITHKVIRVKKIKRKGI